MSSSQPKVIGYIGKCPYIKNPSSEFQNKRIQEYAEELNLEVKHIYSNENVTLNSLLHGPEFTNFLDIITAEDHFVIWSADRITISQYDILDLKNEIEKVKKAKLVILNQTRETGDIYFDDLMFTLDSAYSIFLRKLELKQIDLPV